MSEASTKSCESCGEPVPEESQFCPSCGIAVASQAIPDGDTSSGHAAQPQGEEARQQPGLTAERATTPADGFEPSGLALDWSPELVALVQRAAEIKGTSVDRFVARLVEPAAKKVVQASLGLLELDKAADLLGATRKEVIQLITAGKLRARKVEGEWKVDERSLLEVSKKETVAYDDVELELHHLVKTAGLMGLETEGEASQSASATLCYVSQDGILVCPRSAWSRLGPKQIIVEARDAVRRYMKRRDEELGRL